MDPAKKLEELDWNKNDAKVFVALVELGEANPQEISGHTNIDRTRVYDSLKRLIKKGYCKKILNKPGAKRGGNYRAEKITRVFSKEIEGINTKLVIAQELEDTLKELEDRTENTEILEDIRGKSNVREKIEEFIKIAETRIYWLLSPDVFGPPLQKWAFNALLKAKKERPLEVKISLQINDGNIDIVKELISVGIEVFKRDEPLLPLALLIVDEDQFIQLNISNFEPLPEYYFGIYGENVSAAQMTGMEYLFSHILKDHIQVTVTNINDR
ncbi:MAG: TrmB family transcriptional regulator [Promethearchaeota archaeon]